MLHIKTRYRDRTVKATLNQHAIRWVRINLCFSLEIDKLIHVFKRYLLGANCADWFTLIQVADKPRDERAEKKN